MRVALLSSALLAVACSRERSKVEQSSPAPSVALAAPSAQASAASPVATGVPVPATEIGKAVNPDGMPAYSGPTGAVHGTITVTGDRPPSVGHLRTAKECTLSADMYGPLFREGMMRALADVLVTATGYKGYVPAAVDTVAVEARGCAWNARTFAATFGQRVDVLSKDRVTYMPHLSDSAGVATMVLVPGGDPVQLYPRQPGRYALLDSVHPFMFADVFVLRFATFDVTGLDGKYEIRGVPPGEVTISALLPATMETAQSKVSVIGGQDVEVNLELHFDAKAWSARAKQADAGKPIP